MPISFVCSSCNATLRVADKFAGRKIKCPRCGGVAEEFKAQPPVAGARGPGSPRPPSASAEADRGRGQPPPKRAAPAADNANEDEPQPRRDVTRKENRHEHPRHRQLVRATKPPAQPVGSMKMRYRLMIFLLMIAGCCAYFGILETGLAMRASSEPETISLRNLLSRGPDGNPHIILTDFKMLDDFAIEQTRGTGRWTKVWVPIVPSDTAKENEPTPVRAILFSDKVENAQQVQERFNRKQLQGLIDRDTATPSLSATLMWKQKIPNMDLAKCVVIVEGKEPAGVFKLAFLWLGCAVFLAMTGGVWYLARKMDQNDATQVVDVKPA